MIALHQVSKSFNHIIALREVSFEVEQGEIFGFLGPNGAGKSTTLNIMSTLIQPDTGNVLLEGSDMLSDVKNLRSKIGVVPQDIALYEELSAYQNLLFWGGLYNMSGQALREQAEQALRMVGLWDRKNDSIKTYSGGMKRRINIASSILHKPEILLMDEPTVGVDPQSRSHIFEVIEGLNEQGVTIVYTTHYMEEVERLCNTIAIIDEGEIVADGTLADLKTESKVRDVLSITLSDISADKLTSLAERISFTKLENSKTLEIECVNIAHDISNVIQTIQAADLTIEQVDTKKANLETIFLKLTGKRLRD